MNLDAIKEKIELSQGDITKCEVDVIVNSANTDLILGSGVGGEIGRKGGDVVQEECDRIRSVPLGGAVETTAGDLAAKHIVHAASAEVGHFATEKNVAKATRSALARAEKLQAKTIALPALGTGAAAFPVHRCARIMLDVVARHLAGSSNLEKVQFVLFDEETLDTFREAYGRMGEVKPRGSGRSRGRRSRGGRGGSRRRGGQRKQD
jgi:O-acetyl-ADP-ribose deacetylase (regulator of RNase III)